VIASFFFFSFRIYQLCHVNKLTLLLFIMFTDISLQENILKRFGFLRDVCPLRRALCVKQTECPPQYVHGTGGMLATFLSATTDDVTDQSDVMTSSVSSTTTATPSTTSKLSLQQRHRKFIAHQCKEQTSCSADCRHVGFHWVWNFMLTKRLRSSVTGDEGFQVKTFISIIFHNNLVCTVLIC